MCVATIDAIRVAKVKELDDRDEICDGGTAGGVWVRVPQYLL